MIEETSTSPFPASSPATGTSPSSASAATIGAGSAGSSVHPESPMGTGTGFRASDSAQGTVRRVAQRAHEAVDRLEQTLGASSERMMDLEQEWSGMAREQVRARPLAAIGLAFLAGIMVNKLFMR